MNKVVLLGRTTKDVETRYSQSATPVAVSRVGLAVKRKFAKPGEQDVDFFNLVAFGKVAESLEKYIVKGQPIVAIGHIQQRTWEDSQNVKRTTYEVVVDEWYFAGASPKTQEEGAARQQPVQESLAPGQFEEDDDLPF